MDNFRLGKLVYVVRLFAWTQLRKKQRIVELIQASMVTTDLCDISRTVFCKIVKLWTDAQNELGVFIEGKPLLSSTLPLSNLKSRPSQISAACFVTVSVQNLAREKPERREHVSAVDEPDRL